MIRALSIITGLALIAATAHATVAATGGYRVPQAFVTLAVAAGVGVGAVAIGVALSDRRRALALCIGIALLAGELFGLAGTAERLIERREAASSPIRAAAAARAAAADRLERAETAVRIGGGMDSTRRLEAAQRAVSESATAITAQASATGCRENCRLLLQKTADAARVELAAARAEIVANEQTARAEVEAARLALEAVTVPPSASPLADRLGVPAWAVDLTVAALGAIGANGLAASLLAFGAQRPRRREAVEAQPVAMKPATSQPAPEPLRIARPEPIRAHAARYGVARLMPSDGELPLGELLADYRAWCVVEGIDPAPAPEIGAALDELFRGVGLTRRQAGGAPVIAGVALRA